MACKSEKLNLFKSEERKIKMNKFFEFLRLNKDSHFRMVVFFNSYASIEALIDEMLVLGENSLIEGLESIHSATCPQDKARILAQFCSERQPNDSSKCEILLTSNLTARGIDFKDVDMIVNFDIPTTLQEYLHRAESGLCRDCQHNQFLIIQAMSNFDLPDDLPAEKVRQKTIEYQDILEVKFLFVPLESRQRLKT